MVRIELTYGPHVTAVGLSPPPEGGRRFSCLDTYTYTYTCETGTYVTRYSVDIGFAE